MSFSSAVVITDLNDFIAPSQSCIIKPVKKSEYQVVKDVIAPAEISLTDCLACSGCITSSEQILIQLQNDTEFIHALSKHNTIVSLSSQTRASLAHKYGLDAQEIWILLNKVLKSMGVVAVLDTDFARDIALLESGKEFIARYNSAQELSSSKPRDHLLPMLASSCPGWICYAEKTHHDILHLISSTKSPQQIMGSLIKDYISPKFGPLYHVSIMPCFDKKLEASREDFSIAGQRDVDLVLSTLELDKVTNESMIENLKSFKIPITNNASLSNATTKLSDKIDTAKFLKSLDGEIRSTHGSSSGGYLLYILQFAVKELYGIILSPKEIEEGENGVKITSGRNQDFSTIEFIPPTTHINQKSLKFAYAYGFKNIQNLVRKLKRGRSEYDFVEVMACPSGCINGGGQLKATEDDVKTLVNSVQAVYRNIPCSLPSDNPNLKTVYSDWLGDDEMKIQRALHTQYHPVITDFSSSNLQVQW